MTQRYLPVRVVLGMTGEDQHVLLRTEVQVDNQGGFYIRDLVLRVVAGLLDDDPSYHDASAGTLVRHPRELLDDEEGSRR